MEQKKSSFTGSIGFVLAAAGSAVGLGNIWRFPILAQKHGGGLFLIVYVALVLLFGFALLLTDIAIGRKTGMNAGNAYGAINKKWKWVGHLTFLVPAIILTYYVVIGGWILRYFTEYAMLNGDKLADASYFNSFITHPVAPVVFMLIYLAITAIIVYAGVEKGIEKFSKYVMPALLVLILGIAIYSVTLTNEVDGVVRTGLQGAAKYFVPDFTGMTVDKFINVVLDAATQMFYSLSVAMGIMITYGSYVKKDVNLSKSVTQIQLFDTIVAILAGLMVIPTVFVFPDAEAAKGGPSLMFKALPRVFDEMGIAGDVVGILFFIMVAFAALTSSVSIMETVVASCMEYFKKTRKQMSLFVGVVAALLAVVICMGYNVLYFEVTLPNGATGANLLDIADYVSNNVLMPFITICTCILIGWIAKPKWVIDEVESSGHKFNRKGLFIVVVKFVAPVVMGVLLLRALGII